MGKEERRRQEENPSSSSSSSSSTSLFSSSSFFFCDRCSVRISRLSREFSFRCVAVLGLSLFLLVSAVLLILPSSHRPVTPDSFDADEATKLSASVQAYFRLQKPGSQLLSHIGRLEYDIYSEIGLPYTKVALLSMHPSGASNWTDVEFGVLSDPLNVPLSGVLLSVLRSSFIELFLKECNLTLTNSTFGRPSNFEILKFPGGITIIPVQFPILDLPQVLFNFTLNNSVVEVVDYLSELTDQLKYGLSLNPNETIFVQITNGDGSTVSPPIVVQASVVSTFGSLLPQRLRQLAEAIADSPAKNLGLDHSVFGKVKGVILSSYLMGRLHADCPSPSPAPSPHSGGFAEPPTSQYPALSPSPSLPPSASNFHYPSPGNWKSGHHYSLSPANSPDSATPVVQSPYPCPYNREKVPQVPSPSHSDSTNNLPPVDAPSQLPAPSSFPTVVYGSRPGKSSVTPSFAPSPVASSLSSLAVGRFQQEVTISCFLALLILFLYWL